MINEKRLVALLLSVHAALLAYSASRHSPTDLEPAFLVSGICHWQLERFDLYRANPPLVRLVAAIPVLATGCSTDWRYLSDSPGVRAEYFLASEFIRLNRSNLIWQVVYARWACIPFSLVGAYFAYRWAKDLYRGNAGLFTLVLYVFEPNLLAHGELITPDAAATSFGIVAGYTFWHWLKRPTWARAAMAGGAMGFAEISKLTWLLLFGLWPVLASIWYLIQFSERSRSKRDLLSDKFIAFDSDRSQQYTKEKTALQRVRSFAKKSRVLQLIAIILIALYIINLAYAFDGVFTRLRDFQFVSKAFTGLSDSGMVGNRFSGTLLEGLPVPLPKQYVLGCDVQKRDLEYYYLPSYLRGELKWHGGWWYYYIYGLFVKVSCGVWGLCAMVLFTRTTCRVGSIRLRDEMVLLVPALVILAVVSSQTEFNRHLRYVFPSLGILLVFVGQASRACGNRLSVIGVTTCILLAEPIVSLVLNYPHQLAYFNNFVGGAKNGYLHLTGSSLDWGQDLLYLRDYVNQSGQIVTEIRGGNIKIELAKTVIPDFGSQTASGRRIRVFSPNCLEKRIPFPPDGWMLTPTLWIVENINDP